VADGSATAADPGNEVRALFTSLGEAIENWAAGKRAAVGLRASAPLGPGQAKALAWRLAEAIPSESSSALRAAVFKGDPQLARALAPVADLISQRAMRVYLALEELLRREQAAAFVRRYAEHMAGFSEILTDPDSDDSRAAFTLLAARAAAEAGDLADSVRLCQRAMSMANASTPADWMSDCHALMGVQLGLLDQIPDALAEFEAALALPTSTHKMVELATLQAGILMAAGYTREAVTSMARTCRQARDLGVGSEDLTVVLHMYGKARLADGEPAEAAHLFDEAGALLAQAPSEARLRNLSLKHEVAFSTGDNATAARCFEQAEDLALQAQQDLDSDRYWSGLWLAAGNLVPSEHEAYTAYHEGTRRRLAGDYQAARQHYAEAERLATEAGDRVLASRVQISLAGVETTLGNVDRSKDLNHAVRNYALHAGLAGLQAAAAAGLVKVLVSSGSSYFVGILQFGAEARVLSGRHDELMAELMPRLVNFSFVDAVAPFSLGSLYHDLAHFSEVCGAASRAAEHYQTAIDFAKRDKEEHAEALRIASLIKVLKEHDPQHRSELARLRTRLRKLLTRAERMPVLLRTQARLALLESKPTAPNRTVAELFEIAEEFEHFRATLTSPEGRAEVSPEPNIYSTLSATLAAAGRDTEAWAALQHNRARALMERLTAMSTGQAYHPPDAAEAIDLLARVGPHTALVDIQATPSGLRAFVLDRDGVRRVDALGEAPGTRDVTWGDPIARANELVDNLRRSPAALALARQVRDMTGEQADLLLAVDGILANMPFHLIPIDGQPWGRVQVMGRLPALALLRMPVPTLTGRSVTAGDSRGDLPGAAQECRNVAVLRGGTPFLGPKCTSDAVRTALGAAHVDYLHLAVHGYADPSHGGRSTLLFASAAGGHQWVPYEKLALLPWSARTVVFSGCSTGIGGPRNGTGSYGMTQLAMTGGASTIVSSLWPVDDQGTARLMTAFYEDIGNQQASGRVDLRAALARAAQNTPNDSATSALTRNGRDLRPVEEALPPELLGIALSVSDAFTITGNPIITS
jgi:tetratricopeptide (TPR) repeat protein